MTKRRHEKDAIRTDPAPEYGPSQSSKPSPQPGDEIIAEALSILLSRLRVPGVALTSPKSTIDYLRLQLARHEHEVFSIIFLDNRHRVIAFEELFRGTIDGASVHPREVLKAVLRHNAAAVILAHNHPSGVAEPSTADRNLTDRLKTALALIDVRVLDHIIIGGGAASASFAELGML